MHFPRMRDLLFCAKWLHRPVHQSTVYSAAKLCARCTCAWLPRAVSDRAVKQSPEGGGKGTNVAGFCLRTAKILVLVLLSGCIPLPVVGPVAVPIWPGTRHFDSPGYTVGPVASEQFPHLLQDAIPPGEGMVQIAGPVELFLQQDQRSYLMSAVAALSDSGILLLKWYTSGERYEILGQMPYPEILAASINHVGLGRVISLCMAGGEFSLGGESHTIDPRIGISFIRASGILQDPRKSEAAFALLEERIESVEGACRAADEVTGPEEVSGPE
jgi:hypothetical protein